MTPTEKEHMPDPQKLIERYRRAKERRSPWAGHWRVERLAAFASVDDAIATVRDTPVVTVRPESVETPKGRMVRIPGDAGYGAEFFLSNDPSSI